MKTDLLLIAHFTGEFDGSGNNRFNYLASLFAKSDFDVELVTSDFSHEKKDKRKMCSMPSMEYKVTMINEPAYKTNISPQRLLSHRNMAINLKNYLNKRRTPGLVYCAVPSLDLARVAAEFSIKTRTRFVIDIQDLWPEAFTMVSPVPALADLFLHPLKKMANFIYSSADGIVAVSETYRNKAMKSNPKPKFASVVYLGTDLSLFDKIAQDNIYTMKPKEEIWMAYVGTLGHSYDLFSVIDALSLLKKTNNKLKFIVMGDGPLRSAFEKYASKKQVEIFFMGRLPYADMVGVLSVCDFAVNPIRRGAAQSIINKHADYAAAGLPVINTQECQEYRELVNNYEMGFNCSNFDPSILAQKIAILFENRDIRITMGKNARKLAEEKFDRAKTYPHILEACRSLLNY